MIHTIVVTLTLLFVGQNSGVLFVKVGYIYLCKFYGGGFTLKKQAKPF